MFRHKPANSLSVKSPMSHIDSGSVLTPQGPIWEKVTYELAEGRQVCTCCGGSLHEKTTETCSEIAVAPPQVKVVRHMRQVYACRHCERHELHTPIVTAPMSKPVYPGSLASPSSGTSEIDLVFVVVPDRTGRIASHSLRLPADAWKRASPELPHRHY